MDQIVEACSLLYPGKCCGDILLNYKIEEKCFMTILVKTLGYGIIFGSTMVKVPQIIKLVAAKSGVGVSFGAVILELLALTFSSSYAFANSFPFSAWGESLFLMVMTSLIAFMILMYDQSMFKAATFMAAFYSLSYILMSGFTPLSWLYAFQVCNLPLIITSKLLQAHSNYKKGNTGNLSAITIILVFLGCIARIFTSIKETGDQVVILSYILSGAINGFLVFQMFYYWEATNQYLNKNLAKKTQ